MPATLIYGDRAAQVENSIPEGENLWLSLDDLTAATGWKLKPEGACLDEVCVPLPATERERFLRGEGSWARFNLAALADQIGQPVIHDAERNLWYFGTRWSLGTGPATAQAPDFSLPDADGRLHSLTEQRGKKVLLVTWASW